MSAEADALRRVESVRAGFFFISSLLLYYKLKLEKGKNYLDFFPVFQNNKSLWELHRISDQLLHAIMLPKLGAAYTIRGLICELLQYLDTKEFYHISNVRLNSSSDQLLFSRIGHLMEDTDGRMSRADLEKALCYSGNYINTIVNKYAGMMQRSTQRGILCIAWV